MMFNRLRDLRKKDLGISSTEKLAELLGGEESGWYHQRLQRMETGQTALTDKDAFEISEKLDVPIWAIFCEIPDIEILLAYQNAEDHIQKAIKTLLGDGYPRTKSGD